MNCIAVLKAMSEETRVRILRALLARQMGVGAIAGKLKVSQYNVSKHLRVLKEAGLVVSEKNGQQRLYALAPGLKDRLAAGQNVLELDCCTFRFDKFTQ
jgi:DNA-binding transcriptional ArsR family regulator